MTKSVIAVLAVISIASTVWFLPYYRTTHHESIQDQESVLLYFGASGKTENELKRLLGLTKSKTDIHNAYNLAKTEQTNRFKNLPTEFISVDRLYFSKQINIS